MGQSSERVYQAHFTAGGFSYHLFHPTRTWDVRGADRSERATILIVDHEAELREVLEEYLNGQGYTALGASMAPLTARGSKVK
ncbi:MAG: hypothetical protein M3436_01770 [Pseudomonadota bacterium]|nr:hypothetical protein [Pseudomonadota bacterium]